jgi:hypothetical protein
MNNVELFITYDGPALRDHVMDVKDLAPALIAIGGLFEESNRVLNGSEIKLKIQVKALEPGSFGINLEIIQSTLSHFSNILTGETVTSILNLKEIIIGGVVFGTVTVQGLFGLIRRLKGGKPDSINDLKNGYIEIAFKDETFIIPSKLLELYKEESIRVAVQDSLKPLHRVGIETFNIIDKKKLIEKVSKDEVHFFDAPHIADQKILEYEHESAYSIVSLAFKEDNKWRLHDGSSTISVNVKDESFLNDVEHNRISFAKGDILICKVKTTQYKSSTGLKTEYDILNVIDHQPAGRQLNLLDDLL